MERGFKMLCSQWSFDSIALYNEYELYVINAAARGSNLVILQEEISLSRLQKMNLTSLRWMMISIFIINFPHNKLGDLIFVNI